MTIHTRSYNPEMYSAVHTLLHLSDDFVKIVGSNENHNNLRNIYLRTVSDKSTGENRLTVEKGGLFHPLQWLSRLIYSDSYRIIDFKQDGKIDRNYATFQELKRLHNVVEQITDAELSDILSRLKVQKVDKKLASIKDTVQKLNDLLFSIENKKAKLSEDQEKVDFEFTKLFLHFREPKGSLCDTAKCGDHEIVSRRLSLGAKVDVERDDGLTPLANAAIDGDAKVTKLLLQAGAHIEVKDSEGDTPLLLAARHGHAEVVKLLLAAHGDLECKDKEGNTPLMNAAQNGYVAVVTLLLCAEAKVDCQNLGGCTALTLASESGNSDVIGELLKARANVNVVDNDGDTPLVVAARVGNSGAVKQLLDANADIECKDTFDNTPFLNAVATGQLDVVKMLVALKCNVRATNKQGETALSVLKAQRPHNAKEIHDFLHTHISKDFIDYSRLHKRTKLLAHAFELKGFGRVGDAEIDLGGGTSEMAAREIAKSIALFAEKKRAYLPLADAYLLRDMLECAAKKEITSEQLLESYKAGKPLLLLTGYREHAVTCVLWKDRFIICDRGESTKKTVKLYHVNEKQINAGVIEEIRNLSEQRQSTYQDYMRRVLPKALKCRQTSTDRLIMESIKLSFQVAENCSWAAVEGIIMVLLLLLSTQDLPQRKWKKVAKNVEITFGRWLLFEQLRLLEKYLAESYNEKLVIRSLKLLRKVKLIAPQAFDQYLEEKLHKLETTFYSKAPQHSRRLKAERAGLHRFVSASPKRRKDVLNDLGTLSFIFSRKT